MIEKDEGSQGRQLNFTDNEQNQEFKNKIQNKISYKQYLEACQRKAQKLDPQIV